MMHPPVSPGNNVLVNGGKSASAAAGGGSERASIDAIPNQSKSSSKPAEIVGNCVDDKNRGAGKMQNKDTGVQKQDTPNERKPPRPTPANISDIRLPPNRSNGGTSTGGFVPLQLTSPTESSDYEGRAALDVIDMAAKTPTEPPSPAKGDSKKSEPKIGTKPTTSPTTTSPSKNERSQTQDSTTMPSAKPSAPSAPNGGSSTPPPNPSGGAPYIDDSDSEDEELQELLAQKRDQIRRDIAHFQKNKEMELLVYEKRLRDDHMRRKRRKQAMTNGHPVGTGSPRSYYSLSTKNNIGNIPGYLSLTATPGSTAPARPSGLRKAVESKADEPSTKPEGSEKEGQDTAAPAESSQQPEGLAETKPEIVVKSPPRTKVDSRSPQKHSPAISPITPSPSFQPVQSTASAVVTLSLSNLKAFEGAEKAPSILPSSLKSTSSWASGSGKDSRRSSVNDSKVKKNKHVVFQLEVEGDFFRVKPDGEEIPMDPDEKERLRAESLLADLDYDTDSESDYLEFKATSSKPASKTTEQDGYHPVDDLEGVSGAAAKPNKGPEHPDWISTKPAPEPPVHSSAKSTISEDSMEEDVFDLDEELPYDPPTAQPEFTSGSLEDSVMSLGLPLAPPPPPPPGGSGLALPPAFGVGRAGASFADTLAYIQAYQQAGISRGSSASGSYLSSSFPRNSFGGTSSSWREPAAPAPPRPSSSHGLPTAPSAPVTIGRRASGGLDLVTAPTLEMLSSSISGSVGQGSATLSGSLPIGSGFRRRSVTKYDIPDEDVKDSSASSSVTSKSDLTSEIEARLKQQPTIQAPQAPPQITMPTPTRQVVSARTSSEAIRKASPYGTSAPISIPPRSASVPPVVTEQTVAPEQAKDDVPKEVVSGRPSPQSSNTTEKSNQPATVKVRNEAQKKPVVPPTSVEKVLEATTEALSKNTLPSSAVGGKPKREHKSGSRSGSSTPKYGSYNKKSPSSRSKKPEVKPEPWHGTIIQSFPTDIGNKSLAHDAAQAVSSPGWNSYNSASLLSSSLPKYASGTSTSTFATNPITALPGVKSYSPTAPTIASDSPRKGPIKLNPEPRYSSAVAEAAAAAVEAEGLSSASVVGRPRTDVKSVNRNSLIYADVGPESFKETRLNKETGSLSLSARLALEEAGEFVGSVTKK